MLVKPVSQLDEVLQRTLLAPRPSPKTRSVFHSVTDFAVPSPVPSHTSATLMGPSTK